MSFTCGFFNSKNGDRKYGADTMNRPYKRIVSDGIFPKSDGTASDDFKVESNTALTIKVLGGEGIFMQKWAYLDEAMKLDIPAPHPTLDRIDSVVVQIDTDARSGSIYVKSGTQGSGTAPELTRSDTVSEYRLANITVVANATTITDADIEDTRAILPDCGFITSLITQPDFTTLYDQFRTQFQQWLDSLSSAEQPKNIETKIMSSTASTNGQITFKIPISDYNPIQDKLMIYVNGMYCVQYTDYNFSDDKKSINLKLGVDKGTNITFVLFR